MITLAALVACLALGAGSVYLLWRGEEPGGIDDAYALLFGPPDLGPVDFETLSRRSSPNDALACPEGVCPAGASDIVTPVYPVSAPVLREIVRAVAARQPRTVLVFAARREGEDRFIARSRLMRYPDTVNVRIYGAGEGRSTLALYSRSQIGHSDLGANRARIETWLAAIAEAVERESAVANLQHENRRDEDEGDRVGEHERRGADQ